MLLVTKAGGECGLLYQTDTISISDCIESNSRMIGEK
jgi:hypothetical protein